LRGGIRRGATGVAAVLILAVCGALFGSTSASAAVYWAGSGIGAANLDGSSPNEKYFRPPFPSDSAGPECGLAVSDSHLYWTGSFGLGRVNLAGPATPTTISPHLQQPCGIAIDGSHVYWADRAAGTIGRANLDGTEATTTLIGGLGAPCAVAVDAASIYWVDWRGIGRAGLDGSRAEPGYIPLAAGGCGLALDSRYIYFVGDRGIGRVTYDGVSRQSDFIPGLEEVPDIAVDDGHIYWVDRRYGMYFATIGRANLDGGGASRSWIPTQSFNVGAVAVDGRPSPPPLPLPSRSIGFGKVRHSLKSGTAVLDVSVPERGDLVLTAPGIAWRVLKGPEPPPYRLGSFRWRLKIWPGKTRFGEKISTRLRNRGRATLNLRLSYAEEGQLPVTAKKRLSLLRRLK
jgi:hypothetical protein